MKRLLFLTVFLQIVWSVSNAAPIVGTEALYPSKKVSVVSVDYGTDSTVLTFVTPNDAGNKFHVGHGLYIVDDKGERHHAIGFNGIDVDSVYILDGSGSMRFSVSFTPVGQGNQALDVCDPGHFRIFGIHDSKSTLVIPPAIYGNDAIEDSPLMFEPADVEIEGVLHGMQGKAGSVTFRAMEDYITIPKEEYSASVDGDGHFRMKFRAYAPKWEYLTINTSFGRDVARIYFRPGDRIFIDLYDPSEGKEVKIRNMSGRSTMERLVNTYTGIWFSSFDYVGNMTDNIRHYTDDGTYSRVEEHAAFKSHTFDEQMSSLRKDYEKNLLFADYICWHNRLSPYEARLYREHIQMYYCWLGMETWGAVQNIARYSGQESRRREFGRLLEGQNSGMDFLKVIDPHSTSLLLCHYDGLSRLWATEAALQLEERVEDKDAGFCEKLMEQRHEILRSITGWDEGSVAMQIMTVCEMHYMYDKYKDKHGRELKELYKKVREGFRNPYLRQQLDSSYDSSMQHAD